MYDWGVGQKKVAGDRPVASALDTAHGFARSPIFFRHGTTAARADARMWRVTGWF